MHFYAWLAGQSLVNLVCSSLPAGKNVAFSYLYQKHHTKPVLRSKKESGRETSAVFPLSFSFSFPLCHLWQHLLPLLLFPIMRWVCALCSPHLHCSSQSLSLQSCSHDAPVMTRRPWWNWWVWRNELGFTTSLTPREKRQQIQIKTMR